MAKVFMDRVPVGGRRQVHGRSQTSKRAEDFAQDCVVGIRTTRNPGLINSADFLYLEEIHTVIMRYAILTWRLGVRKGS